MKKRSASANTAICDRKTNRLILNFVGQCWLKPLQHSIAHTSLSQQILPIAKAFSSDFRSS